MGTSRLIDPVSEAVCVDDSESSDVAEIVDIIAESESDGGITEVKTPSAPPLRFQGYRRGRELGRGVSGQVFVCKRAGCAKGFAVKAVNLRRLKLRPNADREWKKLCREVDILRKLPTHPNIVQMVDTFEEGHWMMLVLELVGGGDLFTVLTSRANSKLREGEAAFVLAQLVEGLGFLHSQRVIHRDLKLENVLVASQQKQQPLDIVLYRVKITDFGLSKDVGIDRSEAQSTVGSRPYTAPEVLQEGPHDFSSDVWCLGVLLHVLMIGRFPFDQIPEQQADLNRMLESTSLSEESRSILIGFLQIEPSQRLSLAAVRCHDWLQNLDKLEHAEQPQKRHRTMAEVIDAPEALLSNHIFCPRTPIVVEGQDSPQRSTIDIPETSPVDISGVESAEARGIASVALTSIGTASPVGVASPISAADGDIPGLDNRRGVWTPFAVEAAIQLNQVRPPSDHPDIMQAHVVIPDRLAGFILGKHGARIQQIAQDSGSQVWMTPRDGNNDRRVIVIGTFKQCKVAQELVHELLANARDSDWRDTEAEVVLFVRAVAAGVVTGKHGFVLNQIRKHSGAQIQLLREEVQEQRPIIISGMLQNVLRAEKHVFDLVRAVPAPTDPC
jgi:serine/threonine protein kinase